MNLGCATFCGHINHLFEMILSSEEHLMQIVKQFEKVEPLKKHLDSQHIHESHFHFKKISHVANKIYDSRNDSNNFDKMNALIVQYNEILDLVSKQLILDDIIVTAHVRHSLLNFNLFQLM